MTEPGHDPEQDAVRRLLADARHDGPMPDAVRARLDDVLAGLTAERHEERPTEPVVDLAARRRRRRRTGLLAAAAVVVAGVGLGQVLGNTSGVDTMAGDTAARDSAAQDGSAGAEDRDEAGAEEAAPPTALSESGSLGARSDAAVPDVRSTHLRADLRRLLDTATSSRERVPDTYDASGCAQPLVTGGDRVPITFDGDPATAVLLPPSDGRREAGVYSCLTGEEIRTVRFPAR